MTAPDLRTAALAVSTTWDATWGKVGVVELEHAMAPLIDALRVAALAVEATDPPADDEVSELRAALAELDSEHAASTRIASAMAAAIGWSTPGETWIDKAAHLAPLAAQLEAARELRAHRNGKSTDTEPWQPDWACHPGEMLQDELDERGMTQTQLAEALGHTLKHVNRVCRGHASIEAPFAVRLERVLGPSAELWLRLQMAYDLHHARKATGDA